MSIRKYTAFSTVARCGSVTAAASEMKISQSGLTQLLNSLEDELGVVLMVRSHSGVKLTPEGRKLLPLMQAVIDDDSRVKAEAARFSARSEASPAETLRIVSFASMSASLLPDVIREFKSEHPDIPIELLRGDYSNIDGFIRDRSADILFVRLPLDAKCQTIPLFNDRLMAVLPSSFDTAKLQPGETPGTYKCPASLFETEQVIMPSDGASRDSKGFFRNAGVTPNVCYRIDDQATMLSLVEAGLGIAVVPELMLKNPPSDVKVLPLDPPTFRMIGMAFPDYDRLSEAALAFVATVKRIFKK